MVEPADVAVIIYVRAGADLVAESEIAAHPGALDALRSATVDGVDGGLDVRAGDAVLSWPEVWDRVDGLLAAWIGALDEIGAGAATAIARFPDTRVECEMTRVGDIAVHIEYEDVRATVEVAALQAALLDAASRLLAWTDCARHRSPAMVALTARVAQETQ